MERCLEIIFRGKDCTKIYNVIQVWIPLEHKTNWSSKMLFWMLNILYDKFLAISMEAK